MSVLRTSPFQGLLKVAVLTILYTAIYLEKQR